MALAPLVIACPQCGSTEVFYSCEPKCCFNHVCNHCRTTFEPYTELAGEFAGELGPIPEDLDCTTPTAPCARCGEPKVFALSDGKISQFVCASCKALLTLALGEIAPG